MSKFVRMPDGEYIPEDLKKHYGTDTFFPRKIKRQASSKDTKKVGTKQPKSKKDR